MWDLSTPLLYFANRHLDADGGVRYASHNPPEYSGFKICLGADTLFGGEIQKLRISSNPENMPQAKDRWTNSVYCRLLRLPGRQHSLAPPDGRGRRQQYRRFGGRTRLNGWLRAFELFMDPDGTFPNHEPDPPVPRNLELLSTVVDQGSNWVSL